MQDRRMETHVIYETTNIADINLHVHPPTRVFSDIDNTAAESSQELASDQWFTSLMKSAFQKAPFPSTEQAVIELYHAVHAHTDMQLVEPAMKEVLEGLQQKKIPVIGLTARGAPIADRTIYQLKAIGIRFNIDDDTSTSFELNIPNSNKSILFHKGILFCQGHSKGDALLAYFKHIQHHPTHILMVDDKDKHLKAISDAVKPFASFTGLHYRFLDKKVESIDMEKARQQLVAMYPKLSERGKLAAHKLELIKEPCHLMLRFSIFKNPIENDKKEEPKSTLCPWL